MTITNRRVLCPAIFNRLLTRILPMKKYCIAILVLVAFSIFSCHKADESPTIFEVEVAANYFTSAEDGWIVFHDTDGKILDSRQVTNGQTCKFTTVKTQDNKVGVTLIKVTGSSAELESYLSVSTPTKWTLTPAVGEPGWSCGNQRGDLNIRIQDAGLSPNPLDISFSDSHTSYQPPYNVTVGSYVDLPPYSMLQNCDDDFFLYVYDKNGQPHYKFLENESPGQKTFSLADFNQFDQIVTFNFPQCTMAWLKITGLDNGPTGKTFMINNILSSESTPISSLNAGYLDRFKNYKTQFGAGYFIYGLFYTEVGAIPTSINLPISFKPVILDNGFDTFSYTANEDFIFRNSLYYYFPSGGTDLALNWRVYASKDNTSKSLSSLPQAFATKYPGFKKEKAFHLSTEFYTQYETLEVVEAQRFQGVAVPDAYKHASRIVYY